MSAPQSGETRSAWRPLLPLGIVVLGVVGFAAMVSRKTPPERTASEHPGPLVETIAAPQHSARVTVAGNGTVRPAEQIDLVPQVAGEVIWKSPHLESGGFFERGDLLVQIDGRDYRLALEAAQADVAQNQYTLEVARQEAAIARREWALIHGAEEADTSPLALHLPQLRAAEARLQAARARAEEARLRLERTELYAPFRGRVRTTQLDKGQYVRLGQSVATLYSIEAAEIVMPLADEQLAWIEFANGPGEPLGQAASRRPQSVSVPKRAEKRAAVEAETTSARAGISGWYGGQRHQWQGTVVRSEGELDPRSRMTHLVIRVDDPYRDATAPLVIGMFVDVEIAGRVAHGARRIPRSAMRGANTLWIAGADSTLRVRSVQVAHREGDDILIYADLKRGERVVVSQLHGVTDGMRIRVVERGD